ncbi:hypothetical protein HS99_0017675 [Kitasatospora aureofaciens]|nr:hypothetical protein B6264_29930 [Kitasatospora aureofaciens]OEV38945.1 hypothetical protein HS99_0017675 [Kitasatospora aureofaciens]
MTAVAAAAAVGLAAEPALAATNPTWIGLSTSHGVGVYSNYYASSSKIAPDLFPANGASVEADCWVAGGYVGNDGDVWYHVTWIYLGTPSQTGFPQPANGWVFGPYVDGAAAFHNGTLPNCNA